MILVVNADQCRIVHDTVRGRLIIRLISTRVRLTCFAAGNRRLLQWLRAKCCAEGSRISHSHELVCIDLRLLMSMHQKSRLKVLHPVGIPQRLTFALRASDTGGDAFQVKFGSYVLIKEQMLQYVVVSTRMKLPELRVILTSITTKSTFCFSPVLRFLILQVYMPKICRD